MAGRRIGLVTSERYQNEVPDDELLAATLRRLGYDADRPSWDDKSTNWESYSALVIRSTWDYQSHFDDFLNWISRVEASGILLINPPSILRWNCRKTYLKELEADGVVIPDSVWIEPKTEYDLGAILRENGWSNAVVKPVVGAGGWHTRLVALNDLDNGRSDLTNGTFEGGTLIQEFLPEILNDGEWSLIFFGGEFSHAVIKTPGNGDFRVQTDHGGTQRAAQPTVELVAQAHAVITRAPGPLVYARVDGIFKTGQLILLELEAFEPWCYLEYSTGGAELFARKLIDYMNLSGR